MDVKSLFASRNFAALKPAIEPDPKAEITQGLKQAAIEFAQTLQESEETSMAAMTGHADPHMLVEALTQSELAVDTVVAVRNRVVEAYQEILRMPV